MAGMSLVEDPVPQLGQYEVLVKFQAAALNYGNIAIAKVRSATAFPRPSSLDWLNQKGTFPFAYKYPIVTVSNDANRVVAGSEVREFKIGTTVITLYS